MRQWVQCGPHPLLTPFCRGTTSAAAPSLLLRGVVNCRCTLWATTGPDCTGARLTLWPLDVPPITRLGVESTPALVPEPALARAPSMAPALALTIPAQLELTAASRPV